MSFIFVDRTPTFVSLHHRLAPQRYTTHCKPTKQKRIHHENQTHQSPNPIHPRWRLPSPCGEGLGVRLPSSVSTPSQLRVKSEKLTFIRKKTTFQFINLDGLRLPLHRHRTRVRRRPACKKNNEQFTAVRVKRKTCVSIKQPSRAASDTLKKIYQILPTPHPDNPVGKIYKIYGFIHCI